MSDQKDTRGTVKRCTGKCSRPGAIPHYQDTIHGKGRRFHNTRLGCTVCGTSKYDKMWAPSPNPMLKVRYCTITDRERIGHCPPSPSK